MISDFNFKLNNVGLINNADINLSKINVIGGDNSTGKSTSSKVLYSFLRSNSKTRKELTKNTLINNVLELINDINHFIDFPIMILKIGFLLKMTSEQFIMRFAGKNLNKKTSISLIIIEKS